MLSGRATNLGTEAVTESTDLGEALLLEVLEGELDNGVDGLLGVGVLAVRTFGQPLHEIEVFGTVQGERVAVEDVRNDGVVAVGGVLVGHQLAVLPDADDVGDVQQSDAVVLLALGLGNVGVILANLDGLASRLASVGRYPGQQLCWIGSSLDCNPEQPMRKGVTHSCLTPRVQHCAGGLEAILIV